MPLRRIKKFCKATTQAGKPCRHPAVKGSDFCRMHKPQFKKGHQLSAKHGIYSKAPRLKCSVCVGAGVCEHFDVRGYCFYEKDGHEFSLDDIEHIIRAFIETLWEEVRAYKRGERLEVFQGGVPHPETARIRSRIQRHLVDLYRLVTGAVGAPQMVQKIEIGTIEIKQQYTELRAFIKERLCKKCRRKILEQLPVVSPAVET